MTKKVQLLINGVREIPVPVQRAFRKIEDELNSLIDAVAAIDTSGGGTGTITGAENVGGEAEVFKAVEADKIQLRTIAAGANVTVTQSADTIEIASTGGGGGSGEVNTASNVGSGEGVYKEKVGVDLRLKSLLAGGNVTITDTGDELQIEAAGGSVPLHVLYGDGSDGDANFDGTTTVLGLVPASGVYTLDREYFFHDLTIASGVTIVPAGYVIYVAGTWHFDGFVDMAGGNAGSAGGATPKAAPGPLGVGASGGSVSPTIPSGGGAGGNTALAVYGADAGAAAGGVNTTPGAVGGKCGGGGGGGLSGFAVAGGDGGTVTLHDFAQGGFSAFAALAGHPSGTTAAWTGGSGGGSGATGDSSNPGGGGGAGGGVIVIAYAELDDLGGVVTAAGGSGGLGLGVGGGGTGPGGGGGGGGGGVVALIAGDDNYPTINVSGGAGGGVTAGSAIGKAGGSGLIHKWYGGSFGVGNDGAVPSARQVATTSPLHGGGSLASDLTLTIDAFDSTTDGYVPMSGGGTTNFLRADGSWSAPVGDVTDGSNVGGEAEVFKDKSGTILRHRTIKAGTNVTVTQNANDITIDASGGGGGGGSGLFSPVMSTVPSASSTGLSNWANQPSGATVTDATSGIVLYAPGQSNNDYCAYRYVAVPATTPYTVKMLLVANAQSGVNTNISVGWLNGTTSSAKGHMLQWRPKVTNGPIGIIEWNSLNNGYNNDYSSSDGYMWPFLWVRIIDDGTTIKFEVSPSGDDTQFTTVYSVAKSSGFLGGSGYSYIGFGNVAKAGWNHVCLASWEIT